MSTSRVGGAGDPKEPKSPADEIKDPRLRKIEKVREVDEAENEGRRKKFRSFMESEEAQEVTPRDPSPFEVAFHKSEKELGSALNDLTRPLTEGEDELNNAVDNPENSPPPRIRSSQSESSSSRSPLPQSHEFWHDTSSHPKKGPNTHEGTEEIKNEAKEKVEISQALDPLVLEKKGKKIEKDKLQEEKGTIPIPIQEEKMVKSTPYKMTPEEEAKIRPQVTKKAKERECILVPIEDEAILKKKDHEKDDQRKQSSHTPHIIDIESLAQNQLPTSVIPIAQVATTQATPYLNSETYTLYFQMVGTIQVMKQTPGLTETEIELTSPSFSKSKFFGAKIVIEKYATAPDSLNIRLTGSNQAVKAFNDNISNLYAAFQNGAFDFKIGRISAEYSTERPVFRRKEGKSGGDSDSSRREK